jgi:lipopolysaccharide exporter
MAKGAAWMVLFKLADRTLGLCSIVVLARLLNPDDFGLVALATAVIAILAVLGNFSFDVALIQRKDSDRTYYDTAWTFNVLIGACTGMVVATLAHPAATFYQDSRLADVMYVLALCPIIGSFEKIGVVSFRKEMQFHKEFAFMLTKKAVSVVTVLTLAFALKTYWALALGILVSTTAGAALSYVMSSYRPRLSLGRRKELMNFSSWTLVHNLLNFASTRFGDFVIGKTSGAAALGTYGLALEVATLPTTELGAPINRAVFPAYAKMSHDRAAMQNGYLRVLGILALLTIPAALGIAAVAPVLVPVIFGAKWLAAVPLLQILAAYGLIQALQNNVGPLYYAMGKPRIAALMALAYNFLMIPGIVFGSLHWGSTGAAIALLVASIVIVPINVSLALWMLKLRVWHFAAEVWRPACAGAIMLGVVLAVRQQLRSVTDFPGPLATLIILVLAGGLTYLAAIALLWTMTGRPTGAESSIVEQIHARWATWSAERSRQ